MSIIIASIILTISVYIFILLVMLFGSLSVKKLFSSNKLTNISAYGIDKLKDKNDQSLLKECYSKSDGELSFFKELITSVEPFLFSSEAKKVVGEIQNS